MGNELEGSTKTLLLSQQLSLDEELTQSQVQDLLAGEARDQAGVLCSARLTLRISLEM